MCPLPAFFAFFYECVHAKVSKQISNLFIDVAVSAHALVAVLVLMCASMYSRVFSTWGVVAVRVVGGMMVYFLNCFSIIVIK